MKSSKREIVLSDAQQTVVAAMMAALQEGSFQTRRVIALVVPDTGVPEAVVAVLDAVVLPNNVKIKGNSRSWSKTLDAGRPVVVTAADQISLEIQMQLKEKTARYNHAAIKRRSKEALTAEELSAATMPPIVMIIDVQPNKLMKSIANPDGPWERDFVMTHGLHLSSFTWPTPEMTEALAAHEWAKNVVVPAGFAPATSLS